MKNVLYFAQFALLNNQPWEIVCCLINGLMADHNYKVNPLNFHPYLTMRVYDTYFIQTLSWLQSLGSISQQLQFYFMFPQKFWRPSSSQLSPLNNLVVPCNREKKILKAKQGKELNKNKNFSVKTFQRVIRSANSQTRRQMQLQGLGEGWQDTMYFLNKSTSTSKLTQLETVATTASNSWQQQTKAALCCQSVSESVG